jgi:mono/diheme cytochrome c family protein
MSRRTTRSLRITAWWSRTRGGLLSRGHSRGDSQRLDQLPNFMLRPLNVVQLSRMTRKKRTFPCYGMQWGNSIYLYPIEESLVEYYARPPKPSELQEATMFGGRVGPGIAGNCGLCVDLGGIRDFYLNNVLIHELGHLLDDRNSRQQDRERYAEWFAIEYGYKPSRRKQMAAKAVRRVVRRHHTGPDPDNARRKPRHPLPCLPACEGHSMLDSTNPRSAPARASRLRLRLALRSLLVAGLVLAPVGAEWQLGMAAPTSRQRSTINTLKRKAARVQDSMMRDDLESAEKELREILGEYGRFLAEAQREPGLIPLLEPLFAELSPSHARLELEGVTLPPLKHPEEAGKSPQDGVSFRNQVAGILVSKCGRCHVSSARGGFRMASYDALLRGAGAGIVLVPRDAEGSRLIEVIESGDMPRGGLRVTEEELATLKAWIAAGAEYDGEDPSASLTSLTSERETGPERLPVVRATGEETVHFARDLAPVLAERCAGCHGDGRQNAGQLNLSNFEALLRGGENGPVLVPGEASESLLVRKLRGTAGELRCRAVSRRWKMS